MIHWLCEYFALIVPFEPLRIVYEGMILCTVLTQYLTCDEKTYLGNTAACPRQSCNSEHLTSRVRELDREMQQVHVDVAKIQLVK